MGELLVLRPAPPVGAIPKATATLAWKVHPRGTDEIRVRDALGPLFADTDFTAGVFAEMYSALGQPGLSPALLTMVMILQHRHNLSDEDAARAVADRISWKYALGLDLDDAGFDASVLTEFRLAWRDALAILNELHHPDAADVSGRLDRLDDACQPGLLPRIDQLSVGRSAAGQRFVDAA